MPNESTGREIKLLPGRSLCFQDQTNLYVAVGPMTYTLQATDVPLLYSKSEESFQVLSSDPGNGVVQSPVASEGDYIVLGNPVKADAKKHPDTGKKQGTVELEVGTTVVIPGPARFDLFPGQWAEVIKGHRLNTNQYLRIKVIDAKRAEENWDSAVFEVQVDPSFFETEGKKADPDQKKGLGRKIVEKITPGGPEDKKGKDGARAKTAVINPGDSKPSLITGKEMILKGSAFSFFIPPSGIEVLKDETTGEYVREAVTLQQSQYCILQYEDGVQITVQGPNVVVPLPSQIFLEVGGKKVFAPIELDENSGVYVKVLKKSSFGGKDYEAGSEIFITGKDEKFVFPRPGEWQIVQIDGQIIHHAAPIPPGQGMYVWDQTESKVLLIEGPKMFLPDPRTQRFVTRSLPLHLVKLLFPNSQKALEVNQKRMSKVLRGEDKDVSKRISSLSMSKSSLQSIVDADFVPGVEPEVEGPPISAISFDDNFEGAVAIQVWTNYAIKVTDSQGKSRIEVGPKTVLLAFDEVVEVLEFSKGKPKDHGDVIKDVFLVIKGNHVSDIVNAVTSDNVSIQIPLSYRLNFEEDEASWFNVKNYIQLLCDHMRSFIGNLVKQHSIVEIMANHRNILRDGVLGQKPEEGSRPGRAFKENAMRIYDLEVKEIMIEDRHVEAALVENQREVIDTQIKLDSEDRKQKKEARIEELRRKTLEDKKITDALAHDIAKKGIVQNEELTLLVSAKDLKSEEAKLKLVEKQQEIQDKTSESNLLRQKKEADQLNKIAKAELAIELEKLQSEVNATKEKAIAITPDLISALSVFADKRLAGELFESIGKLQFTSGENVAMILKNTIASLGLPGVLGALNSEILKGKKGKDSEKE